jgi:tetratricopeptide (TPR) repeat protein
MASKIFISYASTHHATADEIALSLRGRGHQVFFDRDALTPGRSYESRLETEIDNSDIIVFLVSPDSVSEGRYTLTELGVVRRKWPHPDGHVLPVIIDDIPFANIPIYLRSVTPLKPVGNIAAEVSAAVERMLTVRKSVSVSPQTEGQSVNVSPKTKSKESILSESRQQRLNQIRREWHLAKQGDLRRVMLVGKMGYGKTLLIERLIESIKGDDPVLFQLSCRLGGTLIDLHPLADWIKQDALLAEDDSPPKKIGKVDEFCKVNELNSRILCDLLSLPYGDRYSPHISKGPIWPEAIEELVRFVLRRTGNKPLLFVVEDVRWIDPSTKTFVNDLLNKLQTIEDRRVLFITTSWPKEQVDIHADRDVKRVNLPPFTDDEVTVLSKQISNNHITDSIIGNIIELSEGNPLYVAIITENWRDKNSVELPKSFVDTVLELASGDQPNVQLNNTIAYIRGSFTTELVAKIMHLDRTKIETSVMSLAARGILTDVFDGKHFIFQMREHFRAPLRNGVSELEARSINQRIAHAIERDSASSERGLLADYFSDAGQYHRAIEHRVEAGKIALNKGYHRTVIELVEKAREEMERAEFVDKALLSRCRYYLSWLQFRALLATKGYVAAETIEAGKQAFMLFSESGLGSEMEYPLLYLKWLGEATLGGHEVAMSTAVETFERATLETSPEPLFVALKARGVSKFFAGQFVQAEQDLSKALDIYDTSDERMGQPQRYGYDLGAGLYAYHCFAQWIIGQLAEAEDSNKKMLSMKLEHSFTDAVKWVWAAQYQGMRRNWYALRKCCEEGYKSQIAEFPMLASLLKIMYSCAEGNLDEKGFGLQYIDLMREGLRSYRATGAKFRLTIFKIMFADALRTARLYEEASDELRAINAIMVETGEYMFASELLRVKGEISVGQGEREQAQQYLVQAMSVARDRAAFLLELRAMNSLAGLLGRDAFARHNERLGMLHGMMRGVDNDLDVVAANRYLCGST